MHVLVLLAVLFSPPAAAAERASFDCANALRTIDQLVCWDPTLMAFDGMAERLAATQGQTRSHVDWLARRPTVCVIPRGSTAPTRRDRWGAIPCLLDVYAARIEALGGVPPPLDAVGERGREADFAHPLCIAEGVLGEIPSTLPLGRCNRAYAHAPVEDGEGGLLLARGSAFVGLARVGYRWVGGLEDGRRVGVIVWSGGGDQTYSAAFVGRTLGEAPEKLFEVEAAIEGGDRCLGGVEDARLGEGGDVLEIDVRITAHDLFALVLDDFPLEPGDDLDASPDGCVGTARLLHPLDHAAPELVSVNLVSVGPGARAGGGRAGDASPPRAQACFSRFVEEATGGVLPYTFSAAELATLAPRFLQACG